MSPVPKLNAIGWTATSSTQCSGSKPIASRSTRSMPLPFDREQAVETRSVGDLTRLARDGYERHELVPEPVEHGCGLGRLHVRARSRPAGCRTGRRSRRSTRCTGGGARGCARGRPGSSSSPTPAPALPPRRGSPRRWPAMSACRIAGTRLAFSQSRPGRPESGWRQPSRSRAAPPCPGAAPAADPPRRRWRARGPCARASRAARRAPPRRQASIRIS